MTIQKRNIAVAVILSIVTCGIYGIYWFIKLNDETNELAKVENGTTGGVAFLLSLITCGIYGLYWAYKQGEKLDTVKQNAGEPTSNQALIYLILSLFGFGIVAYCLMQNEINKAVDRNQG